MNDAAALAGMLPYDTIGLYEQPKPRFIFKMPRVVPDQKSKFESDELFRRLSRESEVSASCMFFLFVLKCVSVKWSWSDECHLILRLLWKKENKLITE